MIRNLEEILLVFSWVYKLKVLLACVVNTVWGPAFSLNHRKGIHMVPGPPLHHPAQTQPASSACIRTGPCMQGLCLWTDFLEDLGQQCERAWYRNAENFKLRIRQPCRSKLRRTSLSLGAVPAYIAPCGTLL